MDMQTNTESALVACPVASLESSNLTVEAIADALARGIINRHVHDLALDASDQIAHMTARNIIVNALALQAA